MLPGNFALQPSIVNDFSIRVTNKEIPCFYYLFCFNENYIGIFYYCNLHSYVGCNLILM